ncbi:MAG: GlxA family transcriptional regulator [Pseudomonadota bacterium]
MDAKLQEKDTGFGGGPPRRIGVLPIPGFALMSYACTVEPLRAANLLSGHTLYDVSHFGDAPLIGSSGAASVERRHVIGETVDLDLLLVVAGGDPFAFRDPATLAWLRRMARRGVRIGGVSGGAVILARAGLMAGRRLAVHWEHAAALAELYPESLVERRLYVIDRDRVTCGGGSAPLDLMHALIADHHGSGFAQEVSDWFLHTDIRGPAAPQRQGVAERLGAQSPHVIEAVAAMESHIGDPLSLKQLALVAQVSPRHLNRLFSDAFGQPVMAYYRTLRLETARRLVRSTSMGLAEIAAATGFAHAGHFSNAYHAGFGVRPREDRRGMGRPQP